MGSMSLDSEILCAFQTFIKESSREISKKYYDERKTRLGPEYNDEDYFKLITIIKKKKLTKSFHQEQNLEIIQQSMYTATRLDTSKRIFHFLNRYKEQIYDSLIGKY